MTQAYPLQWPVGRPRTRRPERSRFGVTFAQARDELINELRLLGARHVVLSTNIALRRDGLPYANQPEPDDTGIAIYFEYKDRPMCFACDRWDRTKDNVQAVRHTIAAMRGLERWGTGDMMDAAFSGFQALPPPDAARPWRDVLGLISLDGLSEAEASFRAKAKRCHPDVGGSEAMMAELNAAIKAARQELGA